MVPLGLFPVLVAMVKIMLIHANIGESLGVTPTPDTTHFHEIVVDKQNFSHSVHKRRSTLKCGTGQYEHPNKSHCCNKCHQGTRVAQHCLGPGHATNCSDCHDGSYTAQQNFAEKCLPCEKCRETFGQITITSCTTMRNTVCGCKVNQYQHFTNPDFSCKNCTACRNGTVLQQCTKYNNTICQCDRGFFLRTHDNTCPPCSSCSGGECKKVCDPLNSVKPQGSSDINTVLGCLVVLFGAGCVLLLARRVLKKSCWKQQKLTFCSYPSVQQPGESVPNTKTTSGEEKTNDCLLEPNQKVELLQQETTSVPLPCQLPDCVKSAGETQIPDSYEVLYTIVDHVPVSRWKEFVRRLGLTENTIERIQMEQRHVREAQYEMLRHWRLQAGRDATVERISSILNQMELSGCSEAIQEVLPKQL